MGELDGTWKVERLGGALPPLPGCVKRISGTSGTTHFAVGPGLPFDVDGCELHYRAPFGAFVDRLEPERDGGYLGRALLLGREFGRFAMRRIDDAEPSTRQAGPPV